jgi:hypothetical protein
VNSVSRDPEGGDFAQFVWNVTLPYPRTMRYALAHPTWTFNALPFFSDLYRRVLEEKYPGFTDEDVVNAMLWERNLTKQWCRWDNSMDMFDEFIEQSPNAFHGSVNKMFFDKKWYPEGIPLAFYIMHNAKVWTETREALAKITSAEKKEHRHPIFWKGKWIDNPDDINALSLPCVL